MKFKTKLRGARNFIFGMITMALIFSLVTGVSALVATKNAVVTYSDIKVVIDDEPVTLKDVQGNSIEPIIVFDTLYAPVSPLARALGSTSTYDGNAKTVYIEKDTSNYTIEVKVDGSATVLTSQEDNPNQIAKLFNENYLQIGLKYNDSYVPSTIISYSVDNGATFKNKPTDENVQSDTRRIGPVGTSIGVTHDRPYEIIVEAYIPGTGLVARNTYHYYVPSGNKIPEPEVTFKHNGNVILPNSVTTIRKNDEITIEASHPSGIALLGYKLSANDDWFSRKYDELNVMIASEFIKYTKVSAGSFSIWAAATSTVGVGTQVEYKFIMLEE